MSTPRMPPPIRRSGATHAPQVRRTARRLRWPTAVSAATSIAGIIIAFIVWNIPVAQTRFTAALITYSVVIIFGTAMLFVQRILDVGVSRISGTPLISRFDMIDKLTFALLVSASIASGIVVALQVARQ